jgi:hypothetical protein
MDTFSIPPIRRPFDRFTDNAEGVSRHEPVQARCRRAAGRRRATAAGPGGQEHRSPHDAALACRKALRVPGAAPYTVGMAAFR